MNKLSCIGVLAVVAVLCVSCTKSSGNKAKQKTSKSERTQIDCKAESACKHLGKCSYVDGYCVVTAEGCKVSRLCKDHGRCSLKDGACAVTSDADCKASLLCKKENRCSAVTDPVSGGALTCDEPLKDKCRRIMKTCKENNPDNPESWDYCLKTILAIDDSVEVFGFCKKLLPAK